MNIGIGCTTFNRPKHLQLWQKQIKECSGEVLVHVSDDSKDRKGISYRKNECLRALKDCDYIFLFDDDCFPIKKGWTEFFIEASKVSGQQHFIYLKETPLIKKIQTANGIDIYDNCAGCCLFLTKEVINKVGAFGDYPAYYGFEHAGYSDRIHAAGLTNLGAYTCPVQAEKYIYAMDLDFHLPFNKMLNHAPSIMNDLHLLETYKNNNWNYYQIDRQRVYIPL